MIVAIKQETPSVKSFVLDLGEEGFTFLPGQWVDCYPEQEGNHSTAGFSMTSSPGMVGRIQLAVKLVGENPVTLFLHQRARTGDVIYVNGGQGDCYYRREMGDSLVLIAGGIGITPFMSMVRYVDETYPDVGVNVVYSARSSSELLFGDQLTGMASRNQRIRCAFTVTQPKEGSWDGRVGRINTTMLRATAIESKSLFYVCGPPLMIDHVINLLIRLEVPNSRIKHEQW